MILHRDLDIGKLSLCPYLPDRKKQNRYFLASELDESDISFLLAKGPLRFTRIIQSSVSHRNAIWRNSLSVSFHHLLWAFSLNSISTVN